MDTNVYVALKNMYHLSGIICILTALIHYYIALFIVPRIDKTRSKRLSDSLAAKSFRGYEYYFSLAAPVFLMRLLGDDIECKITKYDFKVLQINTNISLATFISTISLMYILEFLE